MKKCPFCAEEIQDAAIVCKHCKRDLPVASAAAAVATTATQAPKKKTSMGVKIVVAIFALVFVGWCVSTMNPQSPSSSNAVNLDAKVEFNGLQFTIHNPSNVDWKNGKAEINGIFNGYEYRFGTLAAGQTLQIGALQFAKSNGERFNPIQMKPQEFYVYADLPTGRGVWQGGWR